MGWGVVTNPPEKVRSSFLKWTAGYDAGGLVGKKNPSYNFVNGLETRMEASRHIDVEDDCKYPGK